MGVRRRPWAAILLAGAFALASCTPVTTRQARRLEQGGRLPRVPAESPAPDLLAREAEALDPVPRAAVREALTLLGTPRRDLDCSRFTVRAYEAAGVTLPRTVREQMESGPAVGGDDLAPGDLVFFAFDRRPADHVGIYVGRGQVVHVSSAAESVQMAALGSEVLARAWVGARRPSAGTVPWAER